MCSICYQDDNQYSIKISCGHHFHIYCIQKWWNTQNAEDICPSCPMCRFEPDDDEYEYLHTRHTAILYMRYKNRKTNLKFNNWIIELKSHLDWFETSMEEVLDAPEFIPQQKIDT